MSVRSRTAIWLLPRSETNAKQRLEGGGQGLAAAGLAVGEAASEGEADGDGGFPVVGIVPQADAISAMTARARIQLPVFMSCIR